MNSYSNLSRICQNVGSAAECGGHLLESRSQMDKKVNFDLSDCYFDGSHENHVIHEYQNSNKPFGGRTVVLAEAYGN